MIEIEEKIVDSFEAASLERIYIGRNNDFYKSVEISSRNLMVVKVRLAVSVNVGNDFLKELL